MRSDTFSDTAQVIEPEKRMHRHLHLLGSTFRRICTPFSFCGDKMATALHLRRSSGPQQPGVFLGSVKAARLPAAVAHSSAAPHLSIIEFSIAPRTRRARRSW